jgi:hypothetical protein
MPVEMATVTGGGTMGVGTLRPTLTFAPCAAVLTLTIGLPSRSSDGVAPDLPAISTPTTQASVGDRQNY